MYDTGLINKFKLAFVTLLVTCNIVSKKQLTGLGGSSLYMSSSQVYL